MSSRGAYTSVEPTRCLSRSTLELVPSRVRSITAQCGNDYRMSPRPGAKDEPHGRGRIRQQNDLHKGIHPAVRSIRPVRSAPLKAKRISKLKKLSSDSEDSFEGMQQWHGGFAGLPEFQKITEERLDSIFANLLKGLGGKGDVGREQSSVEDVTAEEMQEWEAAFNSLALPQGSTREARDAMFNERRNTSPGNSETGGEQKPLDDGYQSAEDSGVEMAFPRKKTTRVISSTKPRRPTVAQEIEVLRHSIQQQEKRIIAGDTKLPRPPQIHIDPELYDPPENFVPGSAEATQWIARTKYRYAWKRRGLIKAQIDLLRILENYPRRLSGGIITSKPKEKEVRWLRYHCERLRRDMHAFDNSFHYYRAAHKNAIFAEQIAEQRRVQDEAEHMVFCLSILQSHYEQHTVGSAGKIISWNDGFEFCEGQSPWEHPELPDGVREGYFGDEEPSNSLVGDIVDELEDMMGNMHIGL